MKKVHSFVLAMVALIVGFIIASLIERHYYASARIAMIVSYEHRQAAQALTTLISLRAGDTNAVADSLEHQLDIGVLALNAELEEYPDMKFADNYRGTLHGIDAYRSKYPHRSNDTNLDSIVAGVLAKASNVTGH
jgi:hypothetical protein